MKAMSMSCRKKMFVCKKQETEVYNSPFFLTKWRTNNVPFLRPTNCTGLHVGHTFKIHTYDIDKPFNRWEVSKSLHQVDCPCQNVDCS